MTTSLRIVIADDEPRMRDYMWQSLERLGHQVVAAARTGRELIEQCRTHQPDLIISDIKMPDMDGIEAAAQIYRSNAIPVILVSAFHDVELIERASRNHILAYLVKPVEDTDLAPAIAVARQRFSEFEALRQEAADARQALEDRKVIERAKGILMKRAGLAEPDAFRRLQKLASSKSQKLVDVAQAVVTAEEAVTAETQSSGGAEFASIPRPS
ncbi:MAG: response regulator [Pirellulaceae bacterium]|nr:response regulator [Pirellulaceae bacterium]